MPHYRQIEFASIQIIHWRRQPDAEPTSLVSVRILFGIQAISHHRGTLPPSVSAQRDVQNPHRLPRPIIVRVHLDVLDAVDDVHSSRRAPKDGVLAVEPGRWDCGDEELRAFEIKEGKSM